jgi:pimeloyl-ACP methyl ester carboxylesterase
VVGVVDDFSQLLDRYEIDRFVSVGWSGGGSHALATILDKGCAGVITLAGAGQYGKSDLDFLDGMGDRKHRRIRNRLLRGRSTALLDRGQCDRVAARDR